MERGELLRVDPRSHRAWARGGPRGWREVRLTAKEFAVLTRLEAARGRLVGRAELLRAVWRGEAEEVNPEAVDKRIAALRRKLGEAGALIRTVRGRGYLLAAR